MIRLRRTRSAALRTWLSSIFAAWAITGGSAAMAGDERREPPPPTDQMESLKQVLRTILGDSTKTSAPAGRKEPAPGPGTRLPGRSPNLPRPEARRHSLDADIAAVRADTVFAPFREHLGAGRLEPARSALRTVLARGRNPVEREVAEYDMIELDFFEARFDSAAADYREFAARHPRGYLTNDAIARIFLIDENLDSGPRPLTLFAEAAREARAGHPDSATALLTQAAERYPGSSLEDDIFIALGDVVLVTPNHVAALAYYQAVADSMSQSPLAPAAMMRIGRYHAEVAQNDQAAIGAYERVLERYPESLEAGEARKLIERLRRRT
jgi:TolA-binding protein